VFVLAPWRRCGPCLGVFNLSPLASDDEQREILAKQIV
jgi:hypothetical protein